MFSPDKETVLRWLREDDEGALEALWSAADSIRRENVGDEVHLRGLVEISNHCVRQCHYCGIRAGNTALHRYRMDEQEIIDCAKKALAFGYGTVVLQAGEDPGLTAELVAGVVRRIKGETGLAVTLSLGERTPEEFSLWREAGADRYLLRFETSNPVLYRKIHPSRGSSISDRIRMLRDLRALGYETGSGVMIGVPGQTWDDMAGDIMLFRELDLDMIGVGPFIPHPSTPLWGGEGGDRAGAGQVPNTELMTYKVLALTRITCPQANIPSTTALATLNTAEGRELGLMRGANIVMPNLTPERYRADYEIYPAKACIKETADQCHLCIIGRIRAIGRTPGKGPGRSGRFLVRENRR
jgi:biotin synthase